MAQETIKVYIPEVIVSEILLRLPAKSLGRCRCLSKSWLSITSNPAFVRAHAQRGRISRRHSLDIEEDLVRPTKLWLDFVTMCLEMKSSITSESNFALASCDGLVFFLRFRRRLIQFYIINPLTSQSIILPIHEDDICLLTSNLGFYFHRSTFKYRLIEIMGTNVKVWVVGESSWRHLPGNAPAFFHDARPLDLNGNMCWLASLQSDSHSPDTVVMFDEEQEVFNLISLPPPPLEKRLHNNLEHSLVNFNGGLGLLVVDTKDKSIGVWIMEDQENLSSWIQRYSINFADHIHGICPSRLIPRWSLSGAVIIGDDEELLVKLGSACGPPYCQAPHYLVRCNLKSGACVVRNLMDQFRNTNYVLPYTQTLVNPRHY